MGTCQLVSTRHGVPVKLAFVIGALTLVLVTGCGGGSEESPEPGGSVSVPPAASSPANPTPPPASPSAGTPSPPATTPGRPRGTGTPPAAGEITISGEVVEGVEVGCLLLNTGSREYLLMIPRTMDRSAVRAGARLVVRGQVQTGMVSYCQQGTPFRVSEIRPA